MLRNLEEYYSITQLLLYKNRSGMVPIGLSTCLATDINYYRIDKLSEKKIKATNYSLYFSIKCLIQWRSTRF